MKRSIQLLLALVLISGFISAQKSITLLSSGIFTAENDYSWHPARAKYHAGDNYEWAKVEADDSAWDTASFSLNAESLPKSGWNGSAWFRFRVITDSSLTLKPLMFSVYQAGSTEVFLNGEKILSLPGLTSGRTYTMITFPKAGIQTFAVRYINKDYMTFRNAGMDEGLGLRIGPADQLVQSRLENIRDDESSQKFFMGLVLAFMILHLVLYLFSRESGSNFYYALFLFAYSLNIFFDYQNFLSSSGASTLVWLRLHRTVVPFTQIFLLRFLYSVFEKRTPSQFWPISGILLTAGAFAVWKPVSNYGVFQLISLIAIAEMFRLILRAIINKISDAWILAAGFIFLMFFSSYDMLLDTGLMKPINGVENAYIYGTIGWFVCMSVYLAKEFAKRARTIIRQELNIREQEIRSRVLAADNDRKKFELEEARKIQLAMLPAAKKEFPGLDVSFMMRTATEVGGDYYDYSYTDQGALNIVLGDATGHGAKAGLMVATFKSLFSALGSNLNIPDFFARCSAIVKNMRLGNLFMSITFLRIADGNFSLSAAGMPPVLIYRKFPGTVEEIIHKSMPLGAVLNFPYEVSRGRLQSGDIILLASDGLPELFNEEKAMLGQDCIKETLQKNSLLTAGEITQNLLKLSDEWRGTHPQDDDITIIVVKVK